MLRYALLVCQQAKCATWGPAAAVHCSTTIMEAQADLQSDDVMQVAAVHFLLSVCRADPAVYDWR